MRFDSHINENLDAAVSYDPSLGKFDIRSDLDSENSTLIHHVNACSKDVFEHD